MAAFSSLDYFNPNNNNIERKNIIIQRASWNKIVDVSQILHPGMEAHECIAILQPGMEAQLIVLAAFSLIKKDDSPEYVCH